MPDSLMERLTRRIRCAMGASGTRKAQASSAPVKTPPAGTGSRSRESQTVQRESRKPLGALCALTLRPPCETKVVSRHGSHEVLQQLLPVAPTN